MKRPVKKIMIKCYLCVAALVMWFQGEDYEVRTYPAAKWVSTTTTGMQWDPAISTGFRRLFKYIQGANINSEFGLLAWILLNDEAKKDKRVSLFTFCCLIYYILEA